MTIDTTLLDAARRTAPVIRAYREQAERERRLPTPVVEAMAEARLLRMVTLVGHSYAGVVISGVAARAPERLASLIYLDAYLPMEGQSLFDVLSSEEREASQAALATSTGRRPPHAATLSKGAARTQGTRLTRR